ncbi:hypothetical protein TorRG33x02_223660 [Trema orientale]|uniref:Uncharacterized protein n=1 Tax=Trema orientale TaxID=63057 RepID=A0A2P5E8L2_TREOI|nr:hypothetical protein TorRG33x02_223660 [Trema orientale]
MIELTLTKIQQSPLGVVARAHPCATTAAPAVCVVAARRHERVLAANAARSATILRSDITTIVIVRAGMEKLAERASRPLKKRWSVGEFLVGSVEGESGVRKASELQIVG